MALPTPTPRLASRLADDPADAPGATRVLLVEDDASLRQTLQEFLQDHGYATFTADTNADAWAVVRSVSPALCLLDLNLPDGSGLDLLGCILRDQLDVKVIVMTALPLQHLRARYPQETVAAWLAKPVAPEQLLSAVRTALLP